eukprot:5773370-Prymnesium_polylepis.2
MDAIVTTTIAGADADVSAAAPPLSSPRRCRLLRVFVATSVRAVQDTRVASIRTLSRPFASSVRWRLS